MTCTHDGCARTHYARGWCQRHYLQWHRYGAVQGEPRPKGGRSEERSCSIDGCGGSVRARDLCGLHYERLRKYGDVNVVLASGHPRGRTCAIPGCSGVHQAQGYCQVHYRRFKRHGDPLAGRWNGPRGEGHITTAGYRVIFRPQHPNATKRGQILEHVFAMSEYLGRPLKPHETVHHKNGQRADNRLENLELWASKHPPGQRVVDLVAWAREILAEYEGEV